MLYKINFRLSGQGDKSSKEFAYAVAENAQDAIENARVFIGEFYSEYANEITYDSVTQIPDGSIITCPASLEIIPRDAISQDPILFSQPSSMVS